MDISAASIDYLPLPGCRSLSHLLVNHSNELYDIDLLMYHASVVIGCVHAYTGLHQRLKHIPKKRFRELSSSSPDCSRPFLPWLILHNPVQVSVRTVLVIKLVSISLGRQRRFYISPTQAGFNMLLISRRCGCPDYVCLMTLQRFVSYGIVGPVVWIQITG